jgi:hypothetical protein
MPGLVPGIHVFDGCDKDVDGRVKPGHDDDEVSATLTTGSPGLTGRPSALWPSMNLERLWDTGSPAPVRNCAQGG